MHANRWVVGLDLRPSGQGALRFAQWLAGHGKEGRAAFVGIHVLVEAHLQAALRYHHLDELRDGARAQAEQAVDNAGAGDLLEQLHIVQGRNAEQSLEAARVYHHAEGLIVGRQAPREGHHVLRLGRVARRLLRRLEAPVVVVPPDWEPGVVGADGPVVCASNLGHGTSMAARFAAEMAARLGRSLLVVHTVPVPDDYGAHYIPKQSREKIAAAYQAEGEQSLAAWIEQHGIAGATPVVRQGHVIEQILAQCEETEAAMLVTGSRRLSTVERLLLTSVSSDLAASAPCPVAVVPPLDA